jgi:3-hydroxyisobutyrate dehydrogenase-like beta-hydroxyacid dehydrogenase
MARRIVDAGFPLTVWARRASSVEPFAATAATVAATPAELGAASDVVGVCVVSDDDVTDVLLHPDGVLAGMAPGGLIMVHSTVHPDTCRRIAEATAAAAVLASGTGGSRAAAILAASGFDTTGLRGAEPLLRKDVRITLEVAAARGAAAPTAVAALAADTLTTLASPPAAR